MATEVYTTVELKVQDGTEIEVRPLAVARLRKVMRVWNEHVQFVQEVIEKLVDNAQKEEAGEKTEKPEVSEADLADKEFDIYIDLCGIALEDQLKGEKTTKQYKEYLEENLDRPTIFKILDVTAGLKLGNQNPAETTANPA